MEKKIRRPSKPLTGRPYVPVIRAGNLVYTSGFTGFKENGEVPDDFSEQFRLVIEKAQKHLQSAGATLEQVIQVTVYITRDSDYGTLNSLFIEVFGRNLPTRCCVRVQGLSTPEKRIEMQFVAYIEEAGELK